MKNPKKVMVRISTFAIIFIFMISLIKSNDITMQGNLALANADANVSNKKICWGIKRGKDHEQPDVGASNKLLIDQYNGICLGNPDNKSVYLTFDSRI